MKFNTNKTVMEQHYNINFSGATTRMPYTKSEVNDLPIIIPTLTSNTSISNNNIWIDIFKVGNILLKKIPDNIYFSFLLITKFNHGYDL